MPGAKLKLPEPQEAAGWRVPVYARLIGVSGGTVRGFLRRGLLESVQIGTCRVILTPPQEFLERLKKEQRAKAPGPVPAEPEAVTVEHPEPPAQPPTTRGRQKPPEARRGRGRPPRA